MFDGLPKLISFKFTLLLRAVYGLCELRKVLKILKLFSRHDSGMFYDNEFSKETYDNPLVYLLYNSLCMCIHQRAEENYLKHVSFIFSVGKQRRDRLCSGLKVCFADERTIVSPHCPHGVCVTCVKLH